MGGVRHPLKQGPRAAVKSTCLRHTVASVSANMSDRHVIDLRWSATGDGRKRRDPSPATPAAGSPHPRHPPGLGSGSRTPTGRGNTTRPPTTSRPTTKSSLRVSGGSRRVLTIRTERRAVSIRFEVRGGFRHVHYFRGNRPFWVFQSAVRLAVVPESSGLSSFGGLFVSIRFKVRGDSRPYPLARCPDKPCCGGFTHHSSSPPPTSGQNLSSMG